MTLCSRRSAAWRLSLVLAAALTSIPAVLAQDCSLFPPPYWYIGAVTPQKRLLVLFGASEWFMQHPLPPGAGALPPLTPAEFASAAANSRDAYGSPYRITIGDKFEVRWDGDASITAHVAGFTAVVGNYSIQLGAWLEADAAGQPAVSAADAGPFLAEELAKSAVIAHRQALGQPALFVPVLTYAQKSAIVRALNERLELELPHYLQSDTAARDPRHARLDAALEANPGQPKLAVQGIRLADNRQRLFVRAEWDAAGVPGFLMSAWFSDQDAPLLLSMNLNGADDQRDNGPGSFPIPQGVNLMPPLLRTVFLPMGETAVIRSRYSYENNSILLYLYSDSCALTATDVARPVGRGLP